MKFKIDHDYHIHSCLSSCSNDPGQTPEAILEYAKANNFKSVCITDHFWDSAISGASDWYRPQDFEHISKSLPLPEDKDAKMMFGCETEMKMNKELTIRHELFDKLDFIVVPTNHFHMRGFTIDADAVEPHQRAKIFMEHNHALLDMDLPFTKMGIAHFTDPLLAYYSNGTLFETLEKISDSDFAEFFERAAKCGIGIELNIPLENARREDVLRPYRIAHTCGCKFYLGSDAHTRKAFDGAIARFTAIVDELSLTEDDKFIPHI